LQNGLDAARDGNERAEFSADELGRFLTLQVSAERNFRATSPLSIAWPYNQEEIMRKVVDYGLVATHKHANPSTAITRITGF